MQSTGDAQCDPESERGLRTRPLDGAFGTRRWAACDLAISGVDAKLPRSVENPSHEQLVADGIRSRVVSLPSFELFDAQPAAYRDEVLPPSVTARVAVEAGVKQGWEKYLGPRGRFVGMQSYGASAPGPTLFKHFGITPENVVKQARELLGK